MKAHPVAYLRRSHAGKGANNGRVSFDVQRDAVLEMARRRGDAEPELIVDWGMSGAAAAGTFGGTGRGGRRRAYLDLRAAIEAGEVSALYAYSLSRLARSTRELLDLAESCVAHSVPIRLSKEGDIDGTTPSGRLYLTVLAAVATFEAELAADRAHDRNDSMRELGNFIGRPPWGWLLDKASGRLLPDPVAAPTLARVLELYGELRSPAKVARALNDEGLTAPQGGTWGDGTVRRIIARPPGATAPTTVKGSRAVPAAAFARLLVCHCGSTLTPARKQYRTAAGETRIWVGYTCSQARYVRSHSARRTVPESAILAAVRVEADRFGPPGDRAEIEAADVVKRAELDARRGRIIDALEAGSITRAEADPRLDRISTEMSSIEASSLLADLPPEINWNAPPEAINAFLRTLWHRIELGPDLLPRPDGYVRVFKDWWT